MWLAFVLQSKPFDTRLTAVEYVPDTQGDTYTGLLPVSRGHTLYDFICLFASLLASPATLTFFKPPAKLMLFAS